MPESPSPAPSILSWINSARLRSFEIWLWQRPRIAWTVFITSLLLIFIPGVGGSLWYSFETEPPIPTILRRMLLLSQGLHFSASWITVPIGVAMFVAMFYLMLMGRRASKSELPHPEAELETGNETNLNPTVSPERACPYQWVHDIADNQVDQIARQVELEKPRSFEHNLDAPIPSIGFKFPEITL